MAVIKTVSMSREHAAYVEQHGLSPTALFKIGLERTKHFTLDNLKMISEEEKEDNKALREKIKGLVAAMTVLTERAERAEQEHQNLKNIVGAA